MVAAKAFGVTEFLNPNDNNEPVQQVLPFSLVSSNSLATF